MKRRQFITCFGATLAANTLPWSLAARATVGDAVGRTPKLGEA